MSNIKSFLEKFFLGKTILLKTSSPLNGGIVVFEDLFNRKEIVIDGISQSGPLVKRLWQKAFGDLRKISFEPRNCLVLGFGCGDAAKLINKFWSKARILGIEIDPTILQIGKGYFGTDEIKNLEIKCEDAIAMMEKYAKSKNNQLPKFDLILIDLYCGKLYPPKAERNLFLRGIKKALTKQGISVFNRLNYGNYVSLSFDFYQKIEESFSRVWLKKTFTNLLIFAK